MFRNCTDVSLHLNNGEVLSVYATLRQAVTVSYSSQKAFRL